MTLPKITIVTDYFVPDNKAISIRMKYLAQAFLDRGFEVKILTSKGSKNVRGFDVTTNFITPASNRDNVYIRLAKEILYGVETFFRLLFKKSDYFLLTSPPFTIAFFAVAACVLRKKRYILDVRDEYPEVYFSENLITREAITGKLLTKIEQWMYRNSYLITTVTTSILSKIEHKTKQNKHVWLVRNGYADGINPSLNTLQKPFTVMFHGNMGKFQHPKLILDLAEMCYRNNKSIQFKLFGWGANAALFQRQSLPNLEHNGVLTHEDIKRIIPTVHLGFSFQKANEISRNSFPSKIYEFIGAGVPTLITPKSEAGDFVEAHQIGFQFNPEQTEEIYSKLVFLSENPEELDRLRKNTQLVRNELSRNRISLGFVNKLHKLISENQPMNT
jgi:glycosyltransferase involved in cell wall biosynthesis